MNKIWKDKSKKEKKRKEKKPAVITTLETLKAPDNTQVNWGV